MRHTFWFRVFVGVYKSHETFDECNQQLPTVSFTSKWEIRILNVNLICLVFVTNKNKL